MKFLAFLPLAAAAATVLQPVSYDGHRVFRVPVTDDGSVLRSILDKLDVEVWQPPAKKGAFADIHVPPQSLNAFQEALAGHEVITMHENLGRSIRSEQNFELNARGASKRTWFDRYHLYAEHLEWLSVMATTYSKNAKLVTSGSSFQGNNITGLHIFGSSGGGKQPAVVFHGTVHAREWITSMVIEYFINELATKYGTDSQIKSFVDKYDFYLFPIVNVDGFKYTQTSDRMWRKNRQTNRGSSCLGLDINRNWPHKWGLDKGASKNPCVETFRGKRAGEAPEIKALSTFLLKIKKAQGLKLYIDYHSYSQLFMTPYGYSCDALPPNNDVLQDLANGTASAMFNRYKTEFRYGSICSTIYKASGSSVDYVADVVSAEHTFAAELRDTGHNGFILPPDQIRPSGEEAFDGVVYLLKKMK